jgi:lon-related putative ATP-dependent protease
MSVKPLQPAQLRRSCDAVCFQFETTAELGASNTIIGQMRGTRAIEFGISIRSRGYNIYVLGETGTGRVTSIRRFLREKTADAATPDDWVYVHNFAIPHQPRAIGFPAGEGTVFKARIDELNTHLREDILNAFRLDAYQEEVAQLEERLEVKQNLILLDARQKAEAHGFAIINTASGLTVAPFVDGGVMTQEHYEALSADEQEALDLQQEALENDLENTLRTLRQLQDELRQNLRTLDRNVAETATIHHFNALREQYTSNDEVLLYLAELQTDVLDNVPSFRPKNNDEKRSEDSNRRYTVNLFVDNSKTAGAPVVVDSNPTYHNLIGRIEYENDAGLMTTHFTNLKSGSLHRANGGYLVIEAEDLLAHPMAWEALKRAIKGEEIVLQNPSTFDGTNVLAKSLDPEPIPLDVKIIMLGSAYVYHLLYEREDDFNELFKVKADFDIEIPRDDEHEQQYARFIANLCWEEKLLHFDSVAVAHAVEFGSRLVGDQDKLSARFGDVADLVREASFWASTQGHTVVTGDDVHLALRERIQRANRVEKEIEEEIQRGTLLIATSGNVVGQVNALSVLDMGDYSFGIPSRITARVFMGEGGVVHIDRETDMAGPLHNKGLLTLVGYLGGNYAQEHSLSMSASLTFEQSYSGVDGDSASSAELCVLLSSLADLPVNQGIAITGSINQRGEMQPIGGVTEKIEGFFNICQVQGANGEQGVIIPHTNINNLTLNDEVVAAVAAGTFHIWAVETVDEAMEILTGVPAGSRDENDEYPENSAHARVQARLRHFARLKAVDGDDEDDEDDEESDETES